ncbi:MAG: putative T7SS-secreted protein [Aeromicrobium sp.]
MSEEYPTLGFDPAPGEAERIAQAARSTSGALEAMNEIANVLRGADDGEWRGEAAVRFREMMDDDLRPKIDDAVSAFETAYGALDSWSSTVDLNQASARYYERMAAAAQERHDQAVANLAGVPDAPGPNDPPPENKAEADEIDRNNADAKKYATARDDARDDVAKWTGKARTLQHEHQEEAGRIRGLFADAIDIAPNEPNFLQQGVDWVGGKLDELGDVLADLGDRFLEFLQEIAPLLEFIGDIAGLLGSVLGLLAFIPGLQFLAPFALALAGIGLLAHYLAAAGETGSFLEPFKDPGLWVEMATVAVGALAVFKIGPALTSAARLSGNTRMVPQLLGGAQEIPLGFFSLARGAVPTMETSEFVLRTASLHATWGDWLVQVAQGRETGGFVSDLVTGNVGPMTADKTLTR